MFVFKNVSGWENLDLGGMVNHVPCCQVDGRFHVPDHGGMQVYEFVFFVFCEVLPDGQEMFGYFSREKQNESNHLACILTMPHKQRKGYGGLIIDFSYELARMDGKPGTPERPLSDLGQVCS